MTAIKVGQGASTSVSARSACPSVPALSLAEADEIPIETLVQFALRDGRRPRPIYTAHKWFARRLPSVFRSLLIGVTNLPGTNFEALYYGDADLHGMTVLDPFVGGGTSVFEATRLGATAYGCDVDPVACAVSRLELAAAELPDLQPTFDTLKERVATKVAPFHRSGDDLVLHHFWVQHVRCGSCEAEFDAHPHFVLSDDGKTRFASCVHCDEVATLATGCDAFDCHRCGRHTVCDAGPGKGSRATCPHCGHDERLIEIARRVGKPEWRLFAVETIEPTADRRVVPIPKRKLRRATDEVRTPVIKGATDRPVAPD